MRTIDFRTSDPAEQLAFDEAVLLEADQIGSDESLRLWEFVRPVVVIGRSSKYASEVNEPFCSSRQIPVLRRCSGGASIAAGPGCLMYSVVLSFEERPEVQKIDVAHEFVMQRLLSAVRHQLPSAEMQGTCDLTWNDRKFSGNSLRLTRRHLLYHGTILYGADLEFITTALANPPRQPEYRRQRAHADFITNIPIDARILRTEIARAFDAEPAKPAAGDEPDPQHLQTRTQELRRTRYANPEWNRRH